LAATFASKSTGKHSIIVHTKGHMSTRELNLSARRWPARIAPAVLPLLGSVLFLWIRSLGVGLDASRITASPELLSAPPAARGGSFVGVLIALAIVVVTSRALGALFRYVRQPPVVGEVLAGILLGPTLLGRIAPGVSELVLPRSLVPELGVIAQLGVILYMFVVGVHLDTGALRGKLGSALTIAQASILAPFVLGAASTLWLYPRLATSDVPFGVFAMFVGLSMSVTAFPVLARILSDAGMLRTRLGTLAVGCAAVGDVMAWCLLALTSGLAASRLDRALETSALTIVYIAFVLGAVGPLFRRLCARQELRGTVSPAAVSGVLVALLLSALATELIGIHALFGAFLLGAVVPHESLFAKELLRKLEDLVRTLLLPAFFALIGLKTQIGLVRGVEDWALCALIVLLACVGKLGGTAAAARFSGLGTRDALSLGLLMNTRGLMELIVLDVGLELKIISPKLFAMMVLMALVTTLLTSPLVHWLARGADVADSDLSAVES
jgi:Kef-type K+ transport system membrane component KefB